MCNDIILLLVGAAIGFVSSVGIIIVERLIDRKGKLSIFYKFIDSAVTQHSWGILHSENNRLVFDVPVAFELQNTSNTTRVIRNLNLELYKGDVLVSKMKQMEKGVKRTLTNVNGNYQINGDPVYYGTDNGSYSFVLNPRSIQKQKCDFSLSINEEEKDKYDFDTIKICYYDEKDYKKSYISKTGLKGWTLGDNKPDKEWQKLN